MSTETFPAIKSLEISRSCSGWFNKNIEKFRENVQLNLHVLGYSSKLYGITRYKLFNILFCKLCIV